MNRKQGVTPPPFSCWFPAWLCAVSYQRFCWNIMELLELRIIPLGLPFDCLLRAALYNGLDRSQPSRDLSKCVIWIVNQTDFMYDWNCKSPSLQHPLNPIRNSTNLRAFLFYYQSIIQDIQTLILTCKKCSIPFLCVCLSLGCPMCVCVWNALCLHPSTVFSAGVAYCLGRRFFWWLKEWPCALLFHPIVWLSN